MIKTDELLEKIQFARQNRFLTNCYSNEVLKKCQNLWFVDDNFMFSYNDHGVDRLVFFVEKWSILDLLLEKIIQGKYYLELMTKKTVEYLPKGSIFISRMLRMANLDCSSIFEKNLPILKYKGATEVQLAQENDASEINKLLWSTFRTEISHLLSDEELKKIICDGKITIHKDGKGDIDALLQVDVMPKKFYINQIINKSEKKVIHAILLDRLENYAKTGGKYIYSWVEENNVASRKFHEKYEMHHDGMYNMIYCVER